MSTAQGVGNVPFQRWFKFKEAFSPKFVHDVIQRSSIEVKNILDPFGGSGTTALTSQLMGIKPTTIEVNPFLADLIESKLTSYNSESLIDDWSHVMKIVDIQTPDLALLYKNAPKTLYNNSEDLRWIFNKEIIYRIAQYRESFEKIEKKENKNLLKVLLGAILIPFSNVLINGKGRRYRKNWQSLTYSTNSFDAALRQKVDDAIFDIVRYSRTKSEEYSLFRGDSRKLISEVETSDLVLFSPPYPNTFDYTDIYNVELWALGYLNDSEDNKTLRSNTLRSHVQIKMSSSPQPISSTLSETLDRLDGKRKELWNKNIPDMISYYFHDINIIMTESMRVLENNGMAVIVIGDSRYSDIKIDTTKITCELAKEIGFTIKDLQEIRIMKSSAQQGWAKNLSETAIFLEKNN
ncbi:DNA methyltransferase [Citrobacter koseri]|uniref:DNA methyltransferase n=1 Tax=Citrobacter koseri TaxID=545 RepID=UPI0029428DE7|nr:DNA methyltransferase [Citrobacter koseri]MEB2708225.1 DNA methyltransferase [Citrobacter koseri]MEB2770681.1 DNA methyltransferase [Citrobacter koseri]WOJ27998.1 DNA methyltransferase [Citrobacter koseri]